MHCSVYSSTYLGVEPYLVEVEMDLSQGFPMFSIVGLGDAAILESRYRVTTALKNAGYQMPRQRIVINLSPAGLKKEGAQFDLAIAFGLLLLSSHLSDPYQKAKDYLFLGELSLSGEIKAVPAILATAILAKQEGYRGIVIPKENVEEASLVEGLSIVGLSHIKEVAGFLKDPSERDDRLPRKKTRRKKYLDFAMIKGQAQAKRALEIAAAGGHSLLLMGSPGCGKTLLSEAFPGILPPMTKEETLESMKIHSIAGTGKGLEERPLRRPHHSSSLVSILGGGKKLKPGEVTLASGGVLVLDELSEFSKPVLESLRQPMEEEVIRIGRAEYKLEYPANFLLFASSNPCPCGYAFEGNCHCSGQELARFQKKFSGPILDRIDLYVELRRLSDEELLGERKEESSAEIRKRVLAARKRQWKRYGSKKICNAKLGQEEEERYCRIPKEEEGALAEIMEQFSLSARAYSKILHLARTIADLEGREEILLEDLLEALSFRKKF